MNKPWLTNSILASVRKKSIYFRLYKRGIISYEENKRYKKCLSNVIKQAKRSHYRKLFNDSKNDMKKTWKGISELIGRSKKENINSIVFQDREISDDVGISNLLNHHFSSVAANLELNLPERDTISPTVFIENSSNSFYMFPVTVNEVHKIIISLNDTRYGMDEISTSIFKRCSLIFAVPIAELLRFSLEAGVFPTCLKEASITPIYKSGKRTDMNNYRPIAILPLLSKIFEKIVHNRLNNFFAKFNIISPNQYGFQKRKGTSDALSNLTEYVYKNLNANKHVVSLFIDLKKAYDTVQHDILLDKLECYGIRGTMLEWFGSYLRDRKNYVRIGKANSSIASTNIGVPQGSVLGSLLFTIYINDLPKVSKILNTVLFADDTNFSYAHLNFSDLISTFNIELKNIDAWLIRNRLSLNVSKTTAINFSTRPASSNLNLFMNDSQIKFVNSIKYLGVLLDRKLTFAQHINSVCSKVSMNIGILYKLSLNVPKHLLKNLYFSFISPYLEYCNVIWGNASNIHLNRILILQKRAVRVISFSSRLEHCVPLFQEYGIMTIKNIFRMRCALHAFNNINNFTQIIHNHDTRNRDDIFAEFQRLSVCQNSLSYVAPIIFNNLPESIKNSETFYAFKRKVKLHMILNVVY